MDPAINSLSGVKTRTIIKNPGFPEFRTCQNCSISELHPIPACVGDSIIPKIFVFELRSSTVYLYLKGPAQDLAPESVCFPFPGSNCRYKVTANRVPLPGVESTYTFPPCSLIIP